MEYLRGLRAMREDPQWMNKVGVGCLLILSSMVIPVLGQVVVQGWRAMIVRRAVAGVDTPLPRLELNMDLFGKLLGPGFKSFIARLVWSMPVAMLMVAAIGCLYFGIILVAVGGAAATSDHGAAGGALGLLCLPLGLLVIVPLAVVAQLPAMIAGLRAEITDNLEAAFDMKAVLGMTREMLKELVLGQLVIILLAWGLAIVGLLTCGLGVFPVAIVLNIVHGYFMADIYRLWLERGGEALASGALELEV